MRARATALALGLGLALGLAAAGCAARTPVTSLASGVDSDARGLAAALAQRTLPRRPRPVNLARAPRLFATLGGARRALVAFDLAAARPLWRVEADVASRIAVGGDFLVALEGKEVVGRDQATGARRWAVRVDDTFGGVAADERRAYLVHGAGDPGRWVLEGLDGATGRALWRAAIDGLLGAPAAHGGLVLAPYQHQWLALIDGATGGVAARVRTLDEQLAVLRATSTAAYVGVRGGVFVLDERVARGKASSANLAPLTPPEALGRATLGRDHYDRAQLGYSAADRLRVLWRAADAGDGGALALADDGFAVHDFRYLLGFGRDGALRWAYGHPRADLVATEHTGAVLAAVAASGEVVAVDPSTGAAAAIGSLGGEAPVTGATFDAEGWAPTVAGEGARSTAALLAIARDRDARFEPVKELAVDALARLPGAEITGALLALVDDERITARLKQAVVARLLARRDAASLPALTTALGAPPDYLGAGGVDSLGVVARVIAGMAGVAVPSGDRAAAVAALILHLESPATQSADLPRIIEALAALQAPGGVAERALLDHLLLHYLDDDVAGNAAWSQAIVAAVRQGGPAGRAALARIAADPRTLAALAAEIRDPGPSH